jgi:hypothetical protein
MKMPIYDDNENKNNELFPKKNRCSKEGVECEYATSWGGCSVNGCKNESVMGPKAAWWAGHYYGLW